jgi:hypothetical protein
MDKDKIVQYKKQNKVTGIDIGLIIGYQVSADK